ncbi:MAG TPA: hypothetical protein DC054_23365 [Blastocatellia bacterium]|nr:hypothetical protein [Blastocatellia bacterium]
MFAGSDNNTIGGPAPGSRNVISGNGTNPSVDDEGGIQLGHNLGNIVQNNFIGTDKSGAHALPNGKGVRIFGGINSIIGGTSALTGNLISGNRVVGIEITGAAATGNQIQGNFIGSDVNGNSPIPNATGVLISSASGNLIGGTTPGARNLISGNSQSGVEIDGGNNNQVQGNFIGTDVTGLVALANQHGDGIFINGSNAAATNNVIGGTTSDARNVISGNGLAGVSFIQTSGNLVQGNFIGVGADGTTAVRNTSFGVVFADGATNNTIGGPRPTLRIVTITVTSSG